MPGVLFQPIGRRDFLKFSSKAFAAFVISRGVTFAADGGEPPVRLALLSDLHLAADPKNEYRKFFPAENLKTVLPQVIAANPDGILINGDLARLVGEVADYDALKLALAELATKGPIYLSMGNHDNRDNFYKTFDHTAGERQKLTDKHVLVVDYPAFRLIILDSLFSVSKTGGLLGKAQRDWLANYLKISNGKPIVIFVHHTLGEGDNELLDVEHLFDITVPRRQVKAIIYGHSHAYEFTRHEDLHLINIPAVGYNFADSEPVGWVNALFSAKGAEFTLNSFGGNQKENGKTTSLLWRT